MCVLGVYSMCNKVGSGGRVQCRCGMQEGKRGGGKEGLLMLHSGKVFPQRRKLGLCVCKTKPSSKNTDLDLGQGGHGKEGGGNGGG